MKTKNNTNKKGAVFLVLPVILAVLLIIALLVGVTGRTKTVYIPAPGNASDDFSGTMLADYDNLKLIVYQSTLEFDFNDVLLSDFDFIVMDLTSANLQPNDSYTIGLSLNFNNESLCLTNNFIGHGSGEGYAYYSEPYFIVGSDEVGSVIPVANYTYLLDLRDLKNGKIVVNCYVDGVFSTTNTFTDVPSDIKMTSLTHVFNKVDQNCDSASYGGIYLYGFENADDCTIGDYISDTTLKLTDCKDSMLYTGE